MKRSAITLPAMLLTAVTAVTAVFASPAQGSTAVAAVPPPTVKPFGESIDVRVVNVEAVVTDHKGGRVPGLNAADFRLMVDGHEVPIDYFTEVASGQAVAAKTLASASAPEAAAPPATMATPGEPVGTNFLVYIDDQFAIVPRRNLVLDKLRADLGRLGPNDRMSVLSFDGHRLTRLSDWTGDRQALESVLKAEEERPSFGLLQVAEMRSDEGDRQLIRASGD